MNLRRQLLLVSLLTLILPWSGCQFIRETESALREGQQNMLGGTAQAIADSLSQFPADFLAAGTDGTFRDSQMYVHPLEVEPLIDGYRDEWTLGPESERVLRGVNGDTRFVLGSFRQYVYLGVDVRDSSLVYSNPAGGNTQRFSDHVELVSVDATGPRDTYVFTSEAPGELIGRRRVNGNLVDDNRIRAYWRTTASGYRLEARIPQQMLGDYLGLTVVNTPAPETEGVRSSTFNGATPGRLIAPSALLRSVIGAYAQDDLRLIVTDPAGWRLASAGSIGGATTGGPRASGWLRIAYNSILPPGAEGTFNNLHPLGREREGYIVTALEGSTEGAWFRSEDTGRAVVAVAQPVWSGSVQTGVVILQQGTDAILSLTNSALGRLLSFTIIATVGVGVALLGYASWLSLRIRALSEAADSALDDDAGPLELPSALAGDEIGDLSRSFSNVMRQLGNYNDYLRTLASKLSHELRTPLTIVSSSLENLEHEALDEDAAKYTARARDGAQRLKKILDAMSEANRVEELMRHAELETFDLAAALAAARDAYAATWPDRGFRLDNSSDAGTFRASPELIMQLLDKLIDNAISFSQENDEVVIGLERQDDDYLLSVFNPGPPLPDAMRSQLFDSMVSVRADNPDKHLGLGLHIARIIAEGHGGTIGADNMDSGVKFVVRLPDRSADQSPA